MDQKQRRQAVMKESAGILLLGSAALLIYMKWGVGIPCIFHAVTGYLCPGCGMTRAIARLLQGDLKGAIHYNALSISVLPVLVIYIGYRTVRYVKSGEDGFAPWEYIFLLLTMLVTIGYCIWHNMVGL